MKNTLFLIASFVLFNAQADDITGYCHDTVDTTIKAIHQANYPGSDVISVKTKATHYSGWHQKAYVTEVRSEAEPIKYETLVFEYESEGTTCEIDAVSIIN